MELKENKENGFLLDKKLTAGQEVYSVSELNNKIKLNLENNFSFISLKGEVSNYYCHNQKHHYFDLKDEYSKIRVVMFYAAAQKLAYKNIKIEDGLSIVLKGYVSVYEKRGEYQFIATDAEIDGRGDLLLAFEKLKARLEKMGYFDASVKKAIPSLPGKIGTVTSTGGAVIRDIISVLSSRFENFHLIVRNVNVQGQSSSIEICEAIDDLCRFGVDVIIIARGGGSIEDLWAFNTEEVAKKIFDCKIPVISAIGHETDFTICDFVADARAATPSVAANMVIINKREAIKSMKTIMNKVTILVQQKISACKKDAGFLIKRKIFKKPEMLLLNNWQELDLLKKNLYENINKKAYDCKNRFISLKQLLNKKTIKAKINFYSMVIRNEDQKLLAGYKKLIFESRNNIDNLLQALKASNPVTVIERGFALVKDKNNENIIKSVSGVKKMQEINVFLKDGIIVSKVLDIINKKRGLNNNGNGN